MRYGTDNRALQIFHSACSIATSPFARQEWQDLLDGLTLTLGFKSQIINPLPAQRAAVKLYQLAVAQSVGLQVPKTLISSDPQQAKKFLDVHKGRVVHKGDAQSRNAFMDTLR